MHEKGEKKRRESKGTHPHRTQRVSLDDGVQLEITTLIHFSDTDRQPHSSSCLICSPAKWLDRATDRWDSLPLPSHSSHRSITDLKPGTQSWESGRHRVKCSSRACEHPTAIPSHHCNRQRCGSSYKVSANAPLAVRDSARQEKKQVGKLM